MGGLTAPSTAPEVSRAQFVANLVEHPDQRRIERTDRDWRSGRDTVLPPERHSFTTTDSTEYASLEYTRCKAGSVAPYSPLEWHDFFVGTIGASAALTGLLFVTISINLEQILKLPQLPGRAAGTLGILVCALAVSGFALAPGQSGVALGIEISAAGAVIAVQAVWVTHRPQETDEPNPWIFHHLISLLLPSVAFIVGGLSLIAGRGGGLYWILAAILLAFVAASINAWVLLVEILR